MEDSLRLERPTTEQIALLPPFAGLVLDRIHVLKSPAQFKAALREIETERFVGFDTESKPTFTSDAPRDGPHVIQIALSEQAFIVQVNEQMPLDFLGTVIESESIIKVGFGLKSDRGPLNTKFGLKLSGTVELTQILRSLRYKNALGVKAAVAIVLGQKLLKQKSVTTSNWALPTLHPRQLLYAANDAFAALKVFHALGSPYAVSPAPVPGQSFEPVAPGELQSAAKLQR
jgi:ribonuclease D